MSTLKKYKLTLRYDGTRYKGWQRLKQTEETVQGKIEAVLTRLFNTPIEIDGAGRTDAGVHAMCQVASFAAPEMKPSAIMESLNTYLPVDIVVTSCEVATEKFHARLNAVEKTYAYRLWTASYPPVFERLYVTPVTAKLNVGAMKQCADLLVGKHDFKGFCTDKTKKSTVRTLSSIRFEEDAEGMTLYFTGDGFLYNMVRILTGTLLEVGYGKRTPESVLEILEQKQRALAGETAPAQGLTLVSVSYNS